MTYNLNNIDLDNLNVYNSNLQKEKKEFEIKSHNTFSLSYFNNCNDEFIKVMANNLESIYIEIDKDYEKILKWFNEYIDNVNGVEKFLANRGKAGSIKNSTIRNFIMKEFKN